MDVSALCPEIPPDSSNALSGLCMPTPQTSACSALKESPPAAFFRGLPRAAGVVSSRAVRNNEQRRGEFTVRGSPLGWARAGLPLPVVPRRPLPCCFLREPSLGKSLPSHASASGKETRSKVLAAQCHPHPLPAWPGEVRSQPGLREANTGLKAGDTWVSGAGRRGGEGLMGKKTGAGVRGLT